MSRALWIPGAVHYPGPASKQRGIRPETRGLVWHSAVGDADDALAVLDNTTDPRFDYIAWHATLDYDGTLYQHYPLSEMLNHAAGGREWSVGIEVAGGKVGNESQPWTDAQIVTGAQVERFMLAEGWLPRLSRGVLGTSLRRTLWRHREVPGSSTACDSGRCPHQLLIRLAKAQPTRKGKPVFIITNPRKKTERWITDGVYRRKLSDPDAVKAWIERGAVEILVDLGEFDRIVQAT